ncbi:hypothetical protein [uncultured Roseobacter sp.]|uniref:hypothetical protein n=1 Tax=uncultured Roseobacter sp. TaxID=114847 RepID=UPI002610A3EF|nr:hypothetical protein [uncultured Roseobacter sp.]
MITLENLQGHWRRDWIRAPEFEDTKTRVHWMQAGALFADLRVPLDRPDVTGMTCLADMGPSSLGVLMQAEGFAGHITVQDSKCTWHRQINWHGVPEQSDIGLMSFDVAGGLIEDGVLAEYRELWQAVPHQKLRGTRVSCGEMSGVLIENDDVFLFGIGAEPRGTSTDLIAELASGTVEIAALQYHFASAYVLGSWENGLGTGALSTNPFYEGQVVLERRKGLVWQSVAFDGHCRTQPLLLGQCHQR